MIKRVLLVMAAALVFSAATPSYATFYNHNSHRNSRHSSFNSFRGFNFNFNDCDWGYQQNDCDDNQSWFDCDPPKQDDCDWSFNWDCDWDFDCDEPQEPCDNPVPEPATAGLAFMSLGALTAAVRRRRK